MTQWIRFNNDKWIHHVDDKWIVNKIDGHGGSWSYKNPEGFVVIGYIGNKNKIKVFGYNIILFFKFMKRKLRGELKCHMDSQ